ncbi:MAG: hypothetical protein ACR2NA_02495 [Solirubrobacterales bacterium]
MARKASGQLIVREGARGRSYALRFRAYGQRHHLTLGTEAEGWTRKAAQYELEHTLAAVKRG